MKAKIVRVTPPEAWKLIEKDKNLEFTADEMNKFHRCINASTKLWAGFFDRKFACLYGLVPPTLLADYAVLWLHTNEEVSKNEFLFVRKSQIVVKDMLKEYATIYGFAEVGAERSIRWLKWLGATFSEPNEHMMLPFTIRSK
jgi:hypothetical protein